MSAVPTGGPVFASARAGGRVCPEIERDLVADVAGALVAASGPAACARTTTVDRLSAAVSTSAITSRVAFRP